MSVGKYRSRNVFFCGYQNGLYKRAFGTLIAAADLATIQEQFPVEPLQYLPKTLRLPFEEGMKLLQEAGFEVRCCHPPCLHATRFLQIKLCVSEETFNIFPKISTGERSPTHLVI